MFNKDYNYSLPYRIWFVGSEENEQDQQESLKILTPLNVFVIKSGPWLESPGYIAGCDDKFFHTTIL